MAFTPAGFRRIAAVCDGCGPDWWPASTSTRPTFGSRGEAVDRLPTEHDWQITYTPEGALLMLCPLCALFEACVRRGQHTAAPYINGGIDYGQVCVTCSIPCQWPGVPAGHPESLTAELTTEQELQLAAWDAELFPEEAS